MPLAKQVAVVTLKGLNQKAQGTIAAPGTLELAENLRVLKGDVNGGFEFVRRNGLTTIATIATSTGARLASYMKSLVSLNASEGAVPYSVTDGAYEYGLLNAAVPSKLGRTQLIAPAPTASGVATTITQTSIDIAYAGAVACYVWINQDNALIYTLYDSTSDVQLGSGSLAASGATNAKVVALGTSFYVFWKSANAIVGVSILSTSPFTKSGTTTVVAAGSAFAGTDYDIQAGFDASHIALIYRASAANHVRALLSTAFAVTASVTDSTAADQPDVGQCWLAQKTFAGGNLCYATVNSVSGLKLQTISNTTLANSATISNAAVTAGVNFTGAVGVFGTPTQPYLIYERTTGGTPMSHDVMISDTSASVFFPGAGLASRAFFWGPTAGTLRACVMAVYNSASAAAAPQDAYLLIDVAGQVSFGRIAPGSAWRQTSLHLSSTPLDANGAVHFIGQEAIAVLSASGVLVNQYVPVDLSLSPLPATLGAPVQSGGVLLIPGAQLTEYDGVGYPTGAHEHGFHVAPEPPTLVEGAAASGSISPGTYSYLWMFEWTDRNGQLATSAAGTPVSITTVNVNSSVTSTIYPYIGSPRLLVRAALYRTPNNGDGSIYFRTSPPVFAFSTAGGAQSYVDTASDVTLQSAQPYVPSSAGGELENAPAPAMHVICEHKGRVFGVISESPHRIAFSKEYQVGTSIGFFDGFVISTPISTGPIYALASFDGHLIAIKRDCAYVIDGDFPDATGGGPSIPVPSFLPTGVGTTSPRSVVVTQHGVMFHDTKKGFWQIDRSLQAKYIGGGVEAQANTGSVVVSGACIMPNATEVRFTSEGGTTFVLNTYFLELGTPIWTTFTGQPCVHSLVHEGRWYQLTSDGKLKVENAIWSDISQPGETGAITVGADYFAKLTIADINFSGVLGLSRVWRGQLLGEWKGAHKLLLTIHSNHRSVVEQTFTYDVTADPDPYMMEIRPTVQKRTSMDVTIEETTTGAQQTQGATWTALAFSVGVKPGVSRLPQTKTMVGS